VALSWSGWASRFLVAVDRTSGGPIHRQLELGLRDAIRSGRLGADDSLPSSRLLAEELGLSRGLVQQCYEQLIAEGYLTARAGSRTRVAPGGMTPTPVPSAKMPTPKFPVADFRPSLPDLASFPRSDWQRAGQQALLNLPNEGLGYAHLAGSPAVREVLADYLRRVRAAASAGENVVLCSGFAQGLSLTTRVLADRGLSDIAVEEPGYGPSDSLDVRAVTAAGGRLHRVPVDEHGIDVALLAQTPARVVIVTPAHQSPTGVPLSSQRRQALVRWAETRDGFIVEDDYDSEFRYDRQAIGVLQGLAPQRVFLLGTVSKTLAPALRLGWLVAPPAWTADVLEAKQRADRGSPTLDQETFAVLITTGRYDRHVRAMRKRYVARRDLLLNLLASHAPRVRVSGLAAGLNVVANLPRSVSEEETVRIAAGRGVGLYGMNLYLAEPSAAEPRLVIGFGNVPDHHIRAGIAQVADLLTG
jgi:GntR family transcriptional regulator/MocR family aminotransferase